MGSGIARELLSDAAGSEEGPGDPKEEAEFSPDEEHKQAFLDMCKAIRDGDDEAAWNAYQTCKELG